MWTEDSLLLYRAKIKMELGDRSEGISGGTAVELPRYLKFKDG